MSNKLYFQIYLTIFTMFAPVLAETLTPVNNCEGINLICKGFNFIKGQGQNTMYDSVRQ